MIHSRRSLTQGNYGITAKLAARRQAWVVSRSASRLRSIEQGLENRGHQIRTAD
jgi:hypothetical protein